MKKVSILLLLFIAGCTTIGKPYTPAPKPDYNKSLIHIFREPVSFGNFWITNFLVDDQ